jgi:hypothetical protein
MKKFKNETPEITEAIGFLETLEEKLRKISILIPVDTQITATRAAMVAGFADLVQALNETIAEHGLPD